VTPDPELQGPRYRVDELAAHTGITVRNIREYQDRGLLPPPERSGRIALYADAHVVRLRLVDRLLRRGYPLGVIRELLEAWACGRDLDDVLGFETVVSRPWTDEVTVRLPLLHLRRVFGRQLTVPIIRRAVTLGIVTPVGLRAFDVHSPALLQAGVDLVAAGIPLARVVDVIERVQAELDQPADRLVGMVFDALLPDGTPGGLPDGADLRRLNETIAVLRPHATRAVEALFGWSLQRAVDRRFDLLADRTVHPTD